MTERERGVSEEETKTSKGKQTIDRNPFPLNEYSKSVANFFEENLKKPLTNLQKQVIINT